MVGQRVGIDFTLRWSHLFVFTVVRVEYTGTMNLCLKRIPYESISAFVTMVGSYFN